MADLAMLALLSLALVRMSHAALLERRQFQTDATCTGDFSWAQNHFQQTPCIVAAYVNGACGSNTFKVTKLLPGNRYDPPNSTTANRCSCSWASYNLLQACTACQVASQESIFTWAGFSDPGCGNFQSSEYFPHDIALAEGTAIPAWAATDPRSWPNQQFDPNTARQLASEGKPDLLPNEAPAKSSSPVGPIVGGVVGGLVVIGVACAVFVFLRLRRRKEGNTRDGCDCDDEDAAVPNFPASMQHTRNLSMASKHSLTSGYPSSYGLASPSLMATHTTPSSPTQLGHSDDLHSPYQPISSPSLLSTPSPDPDPAFISSMQQVGGVVTPYTLSSPPLPNDARSEKSRMEGTRLTVYAHPTSPPSVYAETLLGSSRPSTPGIGPSQRRYNPPAYTPPPPTSPLAQHMDLGVGETIPAYSVSESSGGSPRRPRREKESSDGHGSDSSGAGPAYGGGQTHVRSMSDGTVAANSIGSMSEMGGIISRFGAEGDGTATQSGLETGNSGTLHHSRRPAV